jgi:hypothetical protein
MAETYEVEHGPVTIKVDRGHKAAYTLATIGVVGGLAFLLWNLLHGGGKTGTGPAPTPKPDTEPLTFTLRKDGFFWANNLANTYDMMLKRIRYGGRNDVDLLVAGDVIQGAYTAVLQQLHNDGITVYSLAGPVPGAVGGFR